jgi:hypothetical protein
MRSWLEALPAGHGRAAAFETRLWWSPGGATAGITRGLERAGYPSLAKAQRFVVRGAYGPLRDGMFAEQNHLPVVPSSVAQSHQYSLQPSPAAQFGCH